MRSNASVSADSRRVVKAVASGPQLKGGSLTMELHGD